MSLFGDVHWTADELLEKLERCKPMNPVVVLTQLEQLALAHPEIMAILARTIDAAVHSESPAHAIVRHLVREAAEGASDELADALSSYANIDAKPNVT